MYAFKRKERVVDGVRRIAREQCDACLLPLDREDRRDPKTLRHNVRRLSTLLAVIGPVMDGEALKRERAALRRADRCLSRFDREPSGDQARARVLSELDDELSEVRMRAGYWHLNAEEFAALRPGLSRCYGSLRRRVRAMREDPSAQADPRVFKAVLTAHLAQQDALKLIERAWPEAIKPERKRVQALLESALGEQPTWEEAAAWMSETPGRWCDRMGGYWVAWRGGQGQG